MGAMANKQAGIKAIFVGIIAIAVLFSPFAVSHTVYADEKDCGGDEHTHITDGKGAQKVICSGTLAYTVSNLNEGVNVFGVLLQTLVGITVTAAFLFFFWNLAKYIRDDEGKEEAKTKMTWAIAAIFVIVSLWGIVAFIRGVLGVGSQDSSGGGINLPTVNFDKSNKKTITYTITQEMVDADPSLKEWLGQKVEAKPCFKGNGDKWMTQCVNASKCSMVENCELIETDPFWQDYIPK